MKTRYALIFSLFFLACLNGVSQNIVLQQNFNSYLGTIATVPAGWTFSYQGDYTSVAYSGSSGPDSYKFGVNGATVTTPTFANADTLKFWMRGASVDTASSLTISYTPNSINWFALTTLKPLTNSARNIVMPVPNTAIQLKFVYSKSSGNLAFDDFYLIGDSGTTNGSGQNVLNYMKVYFNQPVDNSFTTGPKATYVHNAITDTIAAYINRAKYTIDIAVYDYEAYSSDTMSHIATAINSAYSRGVKIRWIYDGSITSAGLTLLNSNIKKLASPTSGSCYSGGIMHNKFMIIDEYDSLNAIVFTGSADWSITMNDHDYNNYIFLQSRVLARAYTNEFNIMWGDTTHGSAPNASKEKFETCKPNSGTHRFTIGGSEVEVYFSPSDTVNNHVISTINSADVDMYFSMYTFTETTFSTPFVNRHNAGVYTSSVIDQYSVGNPAYNALAALPDFAEYTGSYIYHDKTLVVDPSDACNDPMVLTGSMNWTNAGYTENDENTIIIHNDTIAKLYLQSYAEDYKAISSHSLTKQTGCTILTGANKVNDKTLQIDLYPNPSSGATTIKYILPTDEKLTIEVFTIMGQKLSTIANEEMQSSGEHTYQFLCPTPGIYIVKIQEGQQLFVRKLIQIK